jgi:hypothetical protein
MTYLRPRHWSYFDIIEKNSFDTDETNETKPETHSNLKRDMILGKDLRRYVLGSIEELAKFKDDNILSMPGNSSNKRALRS